MWQAEMSILTLPGWTTIMFFSSQSEKELLVGVRDDVEEDVNKRNKNDFVLWFTKSKFEDQALKWDSPWGVDTRDGISRVFLHQHQASG